MKKELDVDALMLEGNFAVINEWLGKNVHEFGRTKKNLDIIRRWEGKTPEEVEALKKDNEYGTKAGEMVLVHTKKTKASTDHYRLRMWLKDQSLIEKEHFLHFFLKRM